MSRKLLFGLAVLCGGLVVDAQPAAAQQTFNVSLGYFSVRGQDARVAGDVLNANRNFLTFNVNEPADLAEAQRLLDGRES